MAGAALIAGLLFFFLKKRKNAQEGEDFVKIVDRSKNGKPAELVSDTPKLELGSDTPKSELGNSGACYELPEK